MSIDQEKLVVALRNAAREVNYLKQLLQKRVEPIAIISMACRLPGGISNPEEYWNLLTEGKDAIELFPERWNIDSLYDPDPDAMGKTYCKEGGFLKDIDKFDPAFFGIAPREAISMDPQQRLILETVWESLERGGIRPFELNSSKTGVYIGSIGSDYGILTDLTSLDGYAGTGHTSSIISGRVAYLLGLQGPAITIDTACSSSLVALHLATQALRLGECDLALAGGVQVMNTPAGFVEFSRLRATAVDGRCKSFSAQADGAGWSEGCGVLLLKRLSDAERDGDRILALVKGTAVNQDGRSQGLTAPNGPSQQRVIEQALELSNLKPNDIDAIEAHGTGTSLGDPIEANSLIEVFSSTRPQGKPLYLGSSKSNIGHSQAAAGVAGVIKMVLALQHEKLPKTLYAEQPTPHIQWSGSGLELLNESREWSRNGRVRRCGISSFGISGTNAHIILEEAPKPLSTITSNQPLATTAKILLLSAQSEEALRSQAANYASHIEKHPEQELTDISHSAVTYRTHFSNRLSVTYKDRAELIESLRQVATTGTAPLANKAQSIASAKIAFIYPGQGSQWLEMGKELLHSSKAFHQAITQCDEAIKAEANFSVIEQLLASKEQSRLGEIDVVQPVLFAMAVALTAMWQEYGVKPDVVVGHSQGEVVAAYIAGALSLKDAVKVVCSRSRIVKQISGQGLMAMAEMSIEQLKTIISDTDYDGKISIAVSNSPMQTVVSGQTQAIEQLLSKLDKEHIFCRKIQVDYASHSPQIEQLATELIAEMAQIEPQTSKLRFISTVTTEQLNGSELSANYWYRNLREPVYFGKVMEQLWGEGAYLMIEVSAHPLLTLSMEEVQQIANGKGGVLSTLKREQPQLETFHSSLGAAHCYGIEISWDKLLPGKYVGIPTYPFQRQRYWLDTAKTVSNKQQEQQLLYNIDWQEVELPKKSIEQEKCWLLLDNNQTLTQPIIDRLKSLGQQVVVVRQADQFDCTDVDNLQINIESSNDFMRLFQMLGEVGTNLDELVLLLPLLLDENSNSTSTANISPLLNLIKCLAAINKTPQISVITRAGQAVTNLDSVSPWQSMLWGLSRTIAWEYPALKYRVIDLPRDENNQIEDIDLLLEMSVWQDGEAELAIRNNRAYRPRLMPLSLNSFEPGLTINGQSSYFISGGTGALGLAVAKDLVKRGARYLVLTSRSGLNSDEAKKVVTKLQEQGAIIWTPQVDVSNYQQLEQLFADINQELPALRGIFHLAGVVQQTALVDIDEEKWLSQTAAKTIGSLNLHNLTLELELDFFVLFSSASALLGLRNCGIYAAANSFLDGLAAMRRATGLPALSIEWGAWREAGMAQNAGIDQTIAAKLGIGSFSIAAGLNVLHQAGILEYSTLAVLPYKWQLYQELLTNNQRNLIANLLVNEVSGITVQNETTTALTQVNAAWQQMAEEQKVKELETIVQREVASVLGMASSSLDNQRGFNEQGMDSLMATQLRLRLQRLLGITLSSTIAFDYPTVNQLTEYLVNMLVKQGKSQAETRIATVEAKDEPIAIIGAGCRLPGGVRDLNSFWELLDGGIDAVTEIPVERWPLTGFYSSDPNKTGMSYSKWGGFLDEVDKFDAGFFHISPREAKELDPQQRLLMEVSWQALENANITPDTLRRSQTGVFIGLTPSSYGSMTESQSSYTLTGNQPAFLAGRIAYVLGFNGPALVVDTACSSSLVSLHLACQSLRNGECDAALAGGVNLILSDSSYRVLSNIKALSPTGKCHTFSSKADGYTRGEGCGVVVLKRLSDAQRDGDRILAVVRSTAVNHDGASSGLTVPNGPAQQAVIRAALAKAAIMPSELDYLECHGTGTELGDPIEVQAAATVYGEGRTAESPLLIGTVKTNLGHLEAASGIAGVLKVVLALQHQKLPQHLHFSEPNPLIEWEQLPVRVTSEAQEWERGNKPRIAAVSAFGLSGTNAHVILEEAPEQHFTNENSAEPAMTVKLLLLSAQSKEALRNQVIKYAEHIAKHPEQSLVDICHSAANNRTHFNHRLSIEVESSPQLIGQLREFGVNGYAVASQSGIAKTAPAKVAFLFTGQGSQYVGMAKELYESQPLFKANLDKCAEIVEPLIGKSILSLIFAEEGSKESELLNQTEYTQPVLFAIEYALYQLWIELGIKPAALLGHSIGELVAATCAEVFSLVDGLTLAVMRGKLMGSQPTGSMLSLEVDEITALTLIQSYSDSLAIAGINGPKQTVISGHSNAIDELIEKLEKQQVKYKKLVVSHAFHSQMMDSILDEFEEFVTKLQLHQATIPIASNLSGKLERECFSEPKYWANQIRETVRFSPAVEALIEIGITTFIEVGPQPILCGLVTQTLENSVNQQAITTIASLKRRQSDSKTIAEAIGAAWINGIELNWQKVLPGKAVALPTYPFEHERYWLEAKPINTINQISGNYRLSGERIKLPDGRLVHRVQIGPAVQKYLGDHIVYNTIVVPGAFYVAVLLSVGEACWPGSGVELTDVQFIRALTFANNQSQTTILVQLDPLESGYQVTLASEIDENWTVHVTAQLKQLPADGIAKPAAIKMPVLNSAAEITNQLDELLNHFQIKWGEQWWWLKNGQRVSEQTAYGEFLAPQAVPDDDAPIPGGLMDNSFALEVFASEQQELDLDQTPRLPFGVKRLQWYGEHTTPVSALLKLNSQSKESSDSDISYFDKNGQPLALIEGFTTRKAPAEKFLTKPINNNLYKIDWVKLTESKSDNLKQAVVIGKPEFANQLNSICVENITELFSYIDSNGAPERLIILAIDQEQSELMTRLQINLNNALNQLQSILTRAELSNCELLWITKGAIATNLQAEDLELSYAPLWGMVRSARNEYPQRSIRLIDLDVDTDVELLNSAINTEQEPEIALRAGVMYAPRLQAVAQTKDIDKLPLSMPNIVDTAGTVLISGGTGELGSLVARHLVNNYGLKQLLLTSRKGMAAAGAKELKAELEEQGANVEIAACDVSDYASLKAVVETISASTPLVGVIHCAGALDDAVVLEQNEEKLKKALLPKVSGAWNLHQLTKDKELAMFVMFSSLSGVMGGPGQSNYAAANTFLDALAAYRKQQGLAAQSLAWGLWQQQGQGMTAHLNAADLARMKRQGISALTQQEGLQLFDRACAQPHTLLVAAHFDISGNISADMIPPLFREMAQTRKLRRAISNKSESALSLRQKLSTLPESERLTMLVETIGTEVATVLALPSSNHVLVEQSFQELGLDSLMAVELRNRLATLTGVDLPAAAAFRFPNPLSLASELLSLMEKQLQETLTTGSLTVKQSEKVALNPNIEGQGVLPSQVQPLLRPQIVACSPGQKRLWVLDKVLEKRETYNTHVSLILNTRLDFELLGLALEVLVSRHEQLRVCFVERAGVLLQRVLPWVESGLRQYDLSKLVEQQQQHKLEELLEAEKRQPFDLSQPPLFRILLAHLAKNRTALSITWHHIATDASSLAIFLRELLHVYHAQSQGIEVKLPLAPSYLAYSERLNSWLNTAEADQQRAFWRENLAGLEPLLLPTDRPKPANPSVQGGLIHFELLPQLSQMVDEFARVQQCTPFMVLSAVWSILLHRYTGQHDLAFVTFVSGRNREEYKNGIGFFVNTLPVRCDLSGNPNAEDYLHRLRERFWAVMDNQDLPYDEIVMANGSGQRLLVDSLFRASFVFEEESWFLNTNKDITIELLSHSIDGSIEGTAKFDLGLAMIRANDVYQASLEYATDLFDGATIERMVQHFTQLIQEIINYSDKPISQLEMLTKQERHQLLVEWNATDADYPKDKCINELFEEEVTRTPDAIAVVYEEQSLTYAELNTQANQLAYYLRKLGVGPDRLVGICVERGLNMMIGLLAILKAGGAYVPLDPAYPKERLGFMLQDSAPVVLLVERATQVILTEITGDIPRVDLVDDQTQWAKHSEANLERQATGLASEHLAYVIYTSGSTGKPKGVALTHSNATNFIGWARATFAQKSLDRTLFSTSLNFDLAVFECFVPLSVGASIKLVGNALDLLYTPAEVTLINTVPSAMRVLTDAKSIPSSVRTINLAGEPLQQTLVERIFTNSSVDSVCNLYGPTETTTYSTWVEMKRDVGFVPHIGRPIANTRIYLLDQHGKPVPIGVAGELYIGGIGVARGYLNRPDLTAEKFIKDLFSQVPNARMYKTGDLARWLPDGNIEFLGRNDFQVKIRGFRIELGEIEARLVSHPAIREVTVVAREDVAGDKRLVAYYTSDVDVLVEDLRSHLTGTLPDYMVPAAYVRLEAMPLTPNGKLDRKALPAPEGDAYATHAYEAPQSETEQTVANIWAELLKLDKVGRHDNFFELGGHSLLAITLIEQLRRAGLHTDIRTLFTSPTLADLAATISGVSREIEIPPNLITMGCDAITPEMLPLITLNQTDIDRIVATVPGGITNVQDIYALGPLQQGILFHHMLANQGDAYILFSLLAFDSHERLDGFLTSLQDVISRHDILRTAVLWEGLSEPAQVVWRKAILPVETVEFDVSGDIAHQLMERFNPRHYRIDLNIAPLMHAFIAHDRAQNRWLLLLLNHHLTIDHTALEFIVEEIHAYQHGHADQLPVPLPFRNFIAETRLGITLQEQETFFRTMLGDVDETTAPFGLMDVQGDGLGIEEARLRLDDILARRIRERARILSISAASLFHLAWAQVLAKTSGREAVVFGTVLFGRMQGAGSDRILGMFINTLPVCININEASVLESVRQVHTLLAELLRYEHASLALAQRCSSVPASMPLFTALLNYRYSPEGTETDERNQWEGIEVLSAEERTNYPFTLSVDDLGAGFSFTAQTQSPIAPERVCAFMQTAIERLVDALETSPNAAIRSLDVLPAAERQTVLYDWNATDADYPKDKCIHELFEAQVAKTPDAIAVVYEEQQLTYAELNAQANQLAHYLRELGVGPDRLVGICVERGLNMIIGLLAILKAGGAYVPLDPVYPKERLNFMLQDSTPVALLVETATQEMLEVADDIPRVNLVQDLSQWTNLSQSNLSCQAIGLSPKHLAYVIYTSGSTGKPKGVCCHHGGLINLLTDFERRKLLCESDSGSLWTSLSFDVSVYEIFSVLLFGRRLCFPPQELRTSGLDFISWINDNNIKSAYLPAFMLADLAHWVEKRPISLSRLLVGVEPISEKLLMDISKQVPGLQIINGYGPTEATICATLYNVTAEASGRFTAPIGIPVQNSRIYILNYELRLVPTGVAGELYIGGVGVARGYLNRPDLTAEKFIKDPFSSVPNARMYKTGDLARWLPDGNIEFLGRNDFQVKIRGFRIELGEIEARLATHPAIKEVTVMAREDVAGDKRLVAYYTSKAEITVEEMRSHLIATLPEYMVPALYVRLEAMPLTPNGKLDRKALPDPEITREQLLTKYQAPTNQTEELLVVIWSEVLGVEVSKIGVNDNFFDLGGNSLLVIKIISKIENTFNLKVPVVKLFEYSTIQLIASYLNSNASKSSEPTQTDLQERSNKRSERRKELQNKKEVCLMTNPTDGIAIIGMSGRFPGAKDINTFWQNLSNAVESISFFTRDELIESGVNSLLIDNPDYVAASGVIENPALFDAELFGFSPREAEMMDPQHRLFLEQAWAALENAGYMSNEYKELIGVFAGSSLNTYLLSNILPALNDPAQQPSYDPYQIMISSDKDFLTTRSSYKLNLRGPSVVVQSACSTSLVAIYLACQSLLDYECDIALAGGVSIRFPQKVGYLYQKGHIMSPDGHCRAFDAQANGIVRGSGVGVIVLKRLDEALNDRDNIHAIIKGSAINNDGSYKVGYTAPSVIGQAEVIRMAHSAADVDANSISYIECHGTATPLGDPIEIEAITKVFANNGKKTKCALGSVKTNIGHLDAAAGVAGLIKTVLALKHKKIPASLHFNKLNPAIDFSNNLFYVNSALSDWTSNSSPRRAGVSSFGIGGTNAHVVLEEFLASKMSEKSLRNWQVLLVSANTESALKTSIENLKNHLISNPELNLADIAYTLQVGRKHLLYRAMFVCKDNQSAISSLSVTDDKTFFIKKNDRKLPSVIFMFSGQGSQYINMAYHLYKCEPQFKADIEKCAKLLQPYLEENLLEILYPSKDKEESSKLKLKQTLCAQPALFIIEYALAKLLMSWGIEPKAMIGHSLGEYVAACLAGVFTLEEALKLVATRAKLMQKIAPGKMLAIKLPEKEAVKLLNKELSLAAINTTEMCVISGTETAIEELEKQLIKQQIFCRNLDTSHAFHSQMMEPVITPLKEELNKLKLRKPAIPFISNLTGNWITDDEATSSDYWVKHLREPVKFSAGLEVLIKNSSPVLLEIGPGKALTRLASEQLASQDKELSLNMLRHQQEEIDDQQHLCEQLGKLWMLDVAIDWTNYYSHEERHRVELPSYPFERKLYLIDAKAKQNTTQQVAINVHNVDSQLSPDKVSIELLSEKTNTKTTVKYPRPQLNTQFIKPTNDIEQLMVNVWQEILGIEQIGIEDDFFKLGGDSLIAVQLISELQKLFNLHIPINTLIEATTIKELTKLVSNLSSLRELPPSVVRIKPGSPNNRPLFLVHPVGGTVYFYRELAESLDTDQAVYGIEAKGLDGKEETLTTVEEMAKAYLMSVKSLQPKGPYLLGGASFGGLIAYEMAQQLNLIGEEVTLLCMIDTPYPGDLPVSLEKEEDILVYLFFSQQHLENKLELEQFRQLDIDTKKKYLIQQAKNNQIEIEKLSTFIRIFQSNVKAMNSYKPQPYDGKVIYFRAQERRKEYDPLDPEKPWMDLPVTNLKLHIVPGDHITMNSMPNVQIIAEHLKESFQTLDIIVFKVKETN